MTKSRQLITLYLWTFGCFIIFSNCSRTETLNQDASSKNSITDSVKYERKDWDSTLIDEIVQMSEADQKFRQDTVTYKKNYLFQSYIDSSNTKRLLDIIKIYGFPTAERLKKRANTTVILMHAPQSFFPEIRTVIEEENKQGHIFKDEYTFLLWHLNGRVGKPFEN